MNAKDYSGKIPVGSIIEVNDISITVERHNGLVLSGLVTGTYQPASVDLRNTPATIIKIAEYAMIDGQWTEVN